MSERAAFDELDFIRALKGRQAPEARLIRHIGDDMGELRLESPADRILMASDMLAEGVHFDTARDPLELIGRKAVACNLSDCAAMAARPVAVTVSAAVPLCFDACAMLSVDQGIRSMAQEFDTVLIGGDTVRWSGGLVLDVAILAVPWPGVSTVGRDGARPGDRICVSGPLGGSLLGRHLTFTPRVREARELAERLGSDLHAMMDISDGLLLDLHRMCEASGVGACLEHSRLPAMIHPDAFRMCVSCEDPGAEALRHAFSDGEDFELLVAAAADDTRLSGLIQIGTFTPEAGLRMRSTDGQFRTLEPTGYVHR